MILVYAIFRVFAGLACRMPFPLLYLSSGLLRFFLQYIIRYRRSVILRNLSLSFPEKTKNDIRKIMNQFYRNLADIILEVIKLERIDPEKLKNRFSFSGLEILEKEFSRKRSVIVTIGHCGNWEWMGTLLGMVLPVKGFAIIKPLSDKNFHKYMESLRHRINPGSTIPFQHTYRAMVRNKKEMVNFYVMAADQTPTRSEINHWNQFMNQDTPFYIGFEKLARKLDFSVVFMDIRRVGRGRYNGEIQLITDNPASTKDFEITDKYTRLLEDSIRKQPDNWLWSHRRWKFKRNAPAA